MDLHHAIEVEELKAKLSDNQLKYSHLQNDSSLNYASLMQENKRISDEYARLKDRYERMLESNKRLQRNNHCLESKLITAIENISEEKSLLWKDLSKQTSKLMDAKLLIADLYEALEKYRVDCNLALQLLQSEPSTPLSHPFAKLPSQLQSRIQEYLPSTLKKSASARSLTHHATIFPTFPPTATFYSQSNTNDSSLNCVPTADIIDILSIPETLPHRSRKILLCNQCLHHRTLVDTASQTLQTNSDFHSSYMSLDTIHHI